MNTLIGNWLFRLAVAISLAIPAVVPSPAIQSNQLTLVEPSACPPGGCAAGQRLTVHANYGLSTYEPSDQTNVQLCLYLPTDWIGENDIQPELTGEVTRSTYASDIGQCEPAPANYELAGGLATSLTDDRWTSDALDMSFRIGRTASMNGSILVTVLEYAEAAWTRTTQLTLTLPVVPTATTVYVANDAAACSTASPCYVNSSGDLANGVGTGLKDAIDAAPPPATILVLGNYSIKGQSVLVDKAHTISGQNDSTLTYSGSICANPMLRLTGEVTLRGLNINDGSCQSPSRDLVEVNSPSPVRIESNDLSAGQNAIHVLPAAGSVTIRFNHINGNQGYAIHRETGSGGTVDAMANNLFGNRSGVQVECSSRGTVNHNFWGRGIDVQTAVSGCQVDAGKRLGAAIQQASADPGVQAIQTTVTAQKQYSFSGEIGYYRSGTGADYPLFIVNHGRGSAENVPFENPENLVACSNYWDVFLPPGTNPSGTLDLFFKYGVDSSCVAAIELSTEYCKSSDMTRYPLWWYDPATGATAGWDTTGKPLGSAGGGTGQTTTCRTAEDELQVTIDSSGRPNLETDLRFAPFVAAIHSAAITQFTTDPGDKQVNVTWRAASEVNTRGYFLHRSEQQDSGYQVIGDFFPAKGGDMVAANYEYLDKNLTNDKTYYYRLEIVSENLVSTFTNPVSAIPSIPTATPTMTRTPTRTATITRTATVTRTPWVYRTATRAPTRTPYRFPTASSYRSPTPGTTRTATPRFNTSQSPSPQATNTWSSGYPAGTPSPSSSEGYPSPDETSSGGSPVPADSTTQMPVGSITATLTPTGQQTGIAGPGQVEDSSPPAGGSLAVAGMFAGAVLGLAILAVGGWFLWSRSMLPPFFSFLPPPPARQPDLDSTGLTDTDD